MRDITDPPSRIPFITRGDEGVPQNSSAWTTWLYNLYEQVVDNMSGQDPWITHAKQIIEADYGVKVSLEAKNKDLLKFGRSAQVQTSLTTLEIAPTGIYNETYVSTNIITSLSSSSASDTESVVIEGHTVSGGVFAFVTQTHTLTGTTVVDLSASGGTDLARCTRIYNAGTNDLVGNIYVNETDTYAVAGVPDTGSKVHCMIAAGHNQSEKASTTLSNADYWVVTGMYADWLEKQAGFADLELEIRLVGKVFRQIIKISCDDNHRGEHEFKPYLIIPPNSDIRLRATASANGKEISGGIQGALLKA